MLIRIIKIEHGQVFYIPADCVIENSSEDLEILIHESWHPSIPIEKVSPEHLPLLKEGAIVDKELIDN